ncbi:hypothetical protein SAMN04487983_100490 [Streptomyces sp. yr375]|uniref:hypothetical protein n=1 Tax=Streptomyces sp. yr375 TaxID=1761906 RepID=UPI0008C3A22C|nr:hypothetical protein [Streptomyces sp. yr375]SEQ29620.1 hypothetical protein SAMN04487983_100490 [Streptomyces sp. yr375]
MPRPTVAQLTYGSCTVIFSTLAMLLLSQTSSGPGIAVIVVAAVALGVLVAMTVPTPKSSRTLVAHSVPSNSAGPPGSRPEPVAVSAPAAAPVAVPVPVSVPASVPVSVAAPEPVREHTAP